MTARYRCPYCGHGYNNKDTAIKHMGDFHVMKLIALIRSRYKDIEGYGTRKDPNAPPRRLKDHLRTNPGVSGEGDSS